MRRVLSRSLSNNNLTNKTRTLVRDITQGTPPFSRQFSASAVQTAQDLKGRLERHRAHPNNHPFYSYLKEDLAVNGMNPAQWQSFSNNFICRTRWTAPFVALVVHHALLNNDPKTATETTINLSDEMGSGDAEKSHPGLLLRTFNLQSKRVFDLPPIEKLSDAEQSPYITDETLAYKKMQEAFLRGKTEKIYPRIIGCMFAHEGLADDMLLGIKPIFECYKKYYTKEEFALLDQYFAAHRDDEIEGGNVEEMHGVYATLAVERALEQAKKNHKEVTKGSNDFLDNTANFWDSVLREMEHLGKEKRSPLAPPFVKKITIKDEEPNKSQER
jgi:hypothetical protein